jgi:hypothetical protein
VEFRLAQTRPDLASVGTVLQTTRAGKFMRVLFQQPDPDGLAALRDAVIDYEETAVNLEDVYAALMARSDDRRKRAPVKERTADDFEDELLDEGV